MIKSIKIKLFIANFFLLYIAIEVRKVVKFYSSLEIFSETNFWQWVRPDLPRDTKDWYHVFFTDYMLCSLKAYQQLFLRSVKRFWVIKNILGEQKYDFKNIFEQCLAYSKSKSYFHFWHRSNIKTHVLREEYRFHMVLIH